MTDPEPTREEREEARLDEYAELVKRAMTGACPHGKKKVGPCRNCFGYRIVRALAARRPDHDATRNGALWQEIMKHFGVTTINDFWRNIARLERCVIPTEAEIEAALRAVPSICHRCGVLCRYVGLQGHFEMPDAPMLTRAVVALMEKSHGPQT